AKGSLPASGEEIFRGRRPWLPRLALPRHDHRHADLQRPALARGVPRARAARRGDRRARLQHAEREPALPGTAGVARASPPDRRARRSRGHAGERLGMDLELAGLSAHERYKLLIGLVIPRPIAWVSTWSESGVANCAPFSFFNVISEAPPLCILSFNPRSD